MEARYPNLGGVGKTTSRIPLWSPYEYTICTPKTLLYFDFSPYINLWKFKPPEATKQMTSRWEAAVAQVEEFLGIMGLGFRVLGFGVWGLVD